MTDMTVAADTAAMPRRTGPLMRAWTPSWWAGWSSRLARQAWVLAAAWTDVTVTQLPHARKNSLADLKSWCLGCTGERSRHAEGSVRPDRASDATA